MSKEKRLKPKEINLYKKIKENMIKGPLMFDLYSHEMRSLLGDERDHIFVGYTFTYHEKIFTVLEIDSSRGFFLAEQV